MKKPDDLVGYVQFGDAYYPFSFDHEGFSLMVFPPWESRCDFGPIDCDIRMPIYAETRFSGLTSDGRCVIFNVAWDGHPNHGFAQYWVRWFYLHQDYSDMTDFDGFILKGREIDSFYRTSVTLSHECRQKIMAQTEAATENWRKDAKSNNVESSVSSSGGIQEGNADISHGEGDAAADQPKSDTDYRSQGLSYGSHMVNSAESVVTDAEAPAFDGEQDVVDKDSSCGELAAESRVLHDEKDAASNSEREDELDTENESPYLDKVALFSMANEQADAKTGPSCNGSPEFAGPRITTASGCVVECDVETCEVVRVSVSSPCGAYKVTDDLAGDVEVMAAGYMMMPYALPIKCGAAELVTRFSRLATLEDAVLAFRNTHSFLQYISFRKDISISSASLFVTDPSGEEVMKGHLEFRHKMDSEPDEKALGRTIAYDELQCHTAELLGAIGQGSIATDFLCDSYSKRWHYSVGRMMTLFMEFEREYNAIYGKDWGRSEAYLSVRDDARAALEERMNEIKPTGKAKKYWKAMITQIDVLGIGLGDRIQKALVDCQSILAPRVIGGYVGKQNEQETAEDTKQHKIAEDAEYRKIAQGIGKRLGNLRNGLAHSRDDVRFTACELLDLNTLESLLYAMRLKHIGLRDKDIQDALCQLLW